mmetsp:Transcript_24537/g.54620  ORF Transcript_24537/g.54620 Transcript_24537/m.54620 type:complete len:122 (-) Transcript_24537:288-653(-)
MTHCLDRALLNKSQVPSDGCLGKASVAEEVTDVLAYQTFLQDNWESPSAASAILSSFHDMVTKSIEASWFPAGRGRVYCVAEAQKLPEEYAGDLPSQALDAPQLPAVLQGLGDTAERKCSA